MKGEIYLKHNGHSVKNNNNLITRKEPFYRSKGCLKMLIWINILLIIVLFVLSVVMIVFKKQHTPVEKDLFEKILSDIVKSKYCGKNKKLYK
ncbi:hypothetical protein EHP00_1678 [Ecytonucleospora hepatopenaei]|uniref:Uncharacterized protein n=1 Tax=Ecytonucleospora hepatopenaei TaxID=646526 RepID=A0A1W0E8D4_9MICR|nr:hypothetical protein EHP00_1678 [Ecytonucleospora hepatopenaei]